MIYFIQLDMRYAYLLAVISILFSSFSSQANGQGQFVDASVGIRPDSPFFIIERLREKVDLLLTFDKKDKVEKSFATTEQRLAEAEAMLTFKNEQESDNSVKRYESQLLRTRDYLQKAEAGGIDVKETKRFQSEKTVRFLQMLKNIEGRMSERNKKDVVKAISTTEDYFKLVSKVLDSAGLTELLTKLELKTPNIEETLPTSFLPEVKKYIK